MDKKCFADKGHYCMALTEKKCAGCSFYQTKEELEKKRALAEARLLSINAGYLSKYNWGDKHGI